MLGDVFVISLTSFAGLENIQEFRLDKFHSMLDSTSDSAFEVVKRKRSPVLSAEQKEARNARDRKMRAYDVTFRNLLSSGEGVVRRTLTKDARTLFRAVHTALHNWTGGEYTPSDFLEVIDMDKMVDMYSSHKWLIDAGHWKLYCRLENARHGALACLFCHEPEKPARKRVKKVAIDRVSEHLSAMSGMDLSPAARKVFEELQQSIEAEKAKKRARALARKQRRAELKKSASSTATESSSSTPSFADVDDVAETPVQSVDELDVIPETQF